MSREEVTKLLIDFDIPAYEAAHKSDGKYFRYPEIDYCCFNLKEMEKFVKFNNLDPTLVEVDYKPLPPERAFKYIDERMETILGAFKEDIPFQGFLTGRNNFRYFHATILPYKGNRLKSRKPENLQAVRDYLESRYKAIITVGEEADDALGYSQTETSCICSTDKDLNNIPGFHFNWGTGKFYKTSEVECLRSFYGQMILGDRADNILGIYGLAEKSAPYKKLQEFETEEEMFNLVRCLYQQRFGNYGDQFLLETGRLLWIRRKPEELWRFPG